MNMTYDQFRARLCEELAGTKAGELTPWMIEVGYRPEDKDMGFARWSELANQDNEETQTTLSL